jgi:hypothetical protein
MTGSCQSRQCNCSRPLSSHREMHESSEPGLPDEPARLPHARHWRSPMHLIQLIDAHSCPLAPGGKAGAGPHSASLLAGSRTQAREMLQAATGTKLAELL